MSAARMVPSVIGTSYSCPVRLSRTVSESVTLPNLVRRRECDTGSVHPVVEEVAQQPSRNPATRRWHSFGPSLGCGGFDALSRLRPSVATLAQPSRAHAARSFL